MQIKVEEEHYHAMMSYFVRNDLQKIVSHIEVLSYTLINREIL